MEVSTPNSCPICKLDQGNVTELPNNDSFAVACPRCGNFNISRTAAASLKTKLLGPNFLAWIREHTESNTDIPMVDSRTISDVPPRLPSFGYVEKLLLLLRAFQRMSKSAGQSLWVVPEFDYPLAWAADDKEFRHVLRSLIEKCLVRRTDGEEDLSDSFGYMCEIEPTGWEFLEVKKNEISAMDTKVNIVPILRQIESHRNREIDKIRAKYHGRISTAILDRVLNEFDGELSQKAGDMVNAGLPIEEIARHLEATVKRALDHHRNEFETRGLTRSTAYINSEVRWKNRLEVDRDALIERCKISILGNMKNEPSDVSREVISRNHLSLEKRATTIPEWDVFISHASEDREGFARPLAEGLKARGLKIWFDEFTLTVGDSLRRSIDRGLAHSRFGVVVISPDFMRKEWPQKELDGLVAREVEGVKVILPIWHGTTADEIRTKSPILADRLAVSSDKGLDHVINELIRAIEHGEE